MSAVFVVCDFTPGIAKNINFFIVYNASRLFRFANNENEITNSSVACRARQSDVDQNYYTDMFYAGGLLESLNGNFFLTLI